VSDYVIVSPETNSCDNTVQFPTITLLSELGSALPIRSGHIPHDDSPIYRRQVRWGDSSIPGQQTLITYDNTGTAVKWEFIAAQYADEKSEDAAWAWLNEHIPQLPHLEQHQRNEERPEPTTYPPLRLV
jgi:hypothetical protein